MRGKGMGGGDLLGREDLEARVPGMKSMESTARIGNTV